MSKKNITVKVTRRNLNDGYMITPNDLFRGEGVYEHLSPHERILLGAGLSCADGYETTMERIESWVADLGRDRQEAARRRLREQGFLSMSQERFPAGDERAGEFYWAFAFFMDPLPPEERDKLPVKKSPEQKRRAAAARTTPGSSGHDDDHDDSAGRTTPGSSGHGPSGPGDQGGVPIYKKNQGEKNPPLPPVVTSGFDRPNAPSEGEGKPPADNPTAAAAAEVHAKRPDWSTDTIEEALTTVMAAGLGDLAYCRAVLIDLAEGRKYGHTKSPRRIIERGPWWKAAPPPPPAPREPARYCTKTGHELMVIRPDGCSACNGDRKAGYAPEEATTPPEVMEEFRAKREQWAQRNGRTAALAGK